MAHGLPQIILPGELEDSYPVWANDSENANALNNLMGRWRHLSQAWGENSGLTGGTATALRSGATMTSVTSNDPAFMVGITAADLAIAGMTTQMRLVAAVAVASDEPDTTITFGLHAFTGGSSPTWAPTITATAVTGSTVAFSALDPNVLLTGNSGAFTPPADGAYLFCIKTTADTVNTLDYSFHLHLQYRHV
jgi:hypothetical protein